MSDPTLAPLYYTDAQLAQLLVPQQETLSLDAQPTNTQQIAAQMYAQQANNPQPQQAAPQGYARGGHVFPAMHFRGFKAGGHVKENWPDLNVVSNADAVKALVNNQSILSRFGAEAEPPLPQRKPAQTQALPLTEERDDEGFVPGHAKGGRIEPTDAQKHAGNYKKAHARLHGLDIAVENPAGSIRSGMGRDGKPWSVRMPAHYGYIKRTEGADGDHVDVHVGPHLHSPHVHIVDQKDAETGKFDEHKAFMGFEHPHQALNVYHRGFSDGKSHLRMGGMVTMHVDDFKKWVKNKTKTRKPAITHKKSILHHFAAGGMASGIDVPEDRRGTYDMIFSQYKNPDATKNAQPVDDYTENNDKSNADNADDVKYAAPTDMRKGGIVQGYAEGGSVISKFKSPVRAQSFVPPTTHYRDNMGNDALSDVRNSLQRRVNG